MRTTLSSLDPMKLQRGKRPGFEFAALAAGVVGIPHDAPLVTALDQHDAGRGPAILAHRGKAHRVGFGQTLCQRLTQPRRKLGKGLGGGGFVVEAAVLVGFAQLGELVVIGHGVLSGAE
jgi:hypothetical protein